jgi:hypothetical protein
MSVFFTGKLTLCSACNFSAPQFLARQIQPMLARQTSAQNDLTEHIYTFVKLFANNICSGRINFDGYELSDLICCLN